MCIFTASIRHVSSTRIFARIVGQEQLLAYEMMFDADSETAMVLPIPVTVGSGEHALRFIDLEDFPQLFDYLDLLFPVTSADPICAAPAAATLAVHQVGAFEASFVPHRGDFDRLDPRFRLPTPVWDSLPAYDDFGFAVFKLRAAPSMLGRLGLRRRAPSKVHPMALSFATRHLDRLFFPTVHVHDGAVHATAAFDHWLYCQGDIADEEHAWQASTVALGSQVSFRGARGLVDETAPVFRARVVGELPNRDTYVRVSAA